MMTYARTDAMLRADLIKVAMEHVWDIESTLDRDSLNDRTEYRAALESLANQHRVPLRSEVPIH